MCIYRMRNPPLHVGLVNDSNEKVIHISHYAHPPTYFAHPPTQRYRISDPNFGSKHPRSLHIHTLDRHHHTIQRAHSKEHHKLWGCDVWVFPITLVLLLKTKFGKYTPTNNPLLATTYYTKNYCPPSLSPSLPTWSSSIPRYTLNGNNPNK